MKGEEQNEHFAFILFQICILVFNVRMYMLYITDLEIKHILTKMFKLIKGYECHLNYNISAVQYFSMHT